MKGSSLTLKAITRRIAECDQVIREFPNTGKALVAANNKRTALSALRILSTHAKKMTGNNTLVRI